MNCPEDAVEFMTEWWELSGNIVTTLSGLRRLREAYPADYLLTFCQPQEIAHRAAALQELCQYLEGVAKRDPEQI